MKVQEMKVFRTATLMFVLLAAAAGNRPASAGIIITATETAGDVIIAYSGTLDVSGLTKTDQTGIRSRVRGTNTVLQFAPAFANQDRYLNAFSSYPAGPSIGPGTNLINATSTAAGTAAFGIASAKELYLDRNLTVSDWANGQSGSMTFASTTIAGLGIAAGTHTWVLDTTTADTIVFNAGSVSAVPEPSSAIAMGLLGIVGFAGNRRRRRQESVA